jgi:hypothetical protein
MRAPGPQPQRPAPKSHTATPRLLDLAPGARRSHRHPHPLRLSIGGQQRPSWLCPRHRAAVAGAIGGGGRAVAAPGPSPGRPPGRGPQPHPGPTAAVDRRGTRRPPAPAPLVARMPSRRGRFPAGGRSGGGGDPQQAKAADQPAPQGSGALGAAGGLAPAAGVPGGRLVAADRARRHRPTRRPAGGIAARRAACVLPGTTPRPPPGGPPRRPGPLGGADPPRRQPARRRRAERPARPLARPPTRWR